MPVINQYVSVITPQGNLLFPDQATYDAWSNDPRSVVFATGPGGVQYVSIKPQEVENPAPPAEINQYVSVITPQGNLLFPDQATYDAWSNDSQSVAFSVVPGGLLVSIIPQEVENPAPEDLPPGTYYENDGTSSSNIPYPQLTPDEEQLAALGDAQAGPGEVSYFSPPPDDTIYYENDGTSSSAIPYPQLTPEEQALAALGDAQAGPGEVSFSPLSTRGISTSLLNTRSQATTQDTFNALAQGDWRVRLSLAPGAKYLYAGGNPGILAPLKDTYGVLFPYTPSISVTYAASYDPSELVHSNYKIYQYKGSSVDTIQITCDFTAQDTHEANYLLAVIHFFRTVTKMFYGQDQNPTLGTPPPLCYLTGMGAFQFDRHPLAITSFNYSLPTDVDYIQAGNAAMIAGMNRQQTGEQVVPRFGMDITAGGVPAGPSWNTTPTGSVEPTYIPTKMQITISAIPIVSRNDISKRFSLDGYGSGALLRGSKNNGAGIW